MTFSIRHFLRQIPVPTVKEYFNSKHAVTPSEWWRQAESKLASQLAEFVLSGPNRQTTDSILADIARLHPMANERGRRALLNAAAGQDEVVERFGKLQNDHERALWMLMTHPDLFRDAEGLRFFDYYAEGSYGRHFKTEPNLSVSEFEQDVTLFADELRQFYRRRDGSGVSCHVEFTKRQQEGSIQVNVYVEGLPNNVVEFIDREFRRRVSHPALEAAIVYDPATGHTSTVAKGGKDVHEALRQTFAQKLLKIEPKFDAVVRRPFVLDSLKAPMPLAVDPSLGIKAVRVRKLRLAPPDFGSGYLTVEAPGQPDTSVYDLGNSWFVEGARLFGKFKVLHATIAMYFHPPPDSKRARIINIELSYPNGSNLNRLPDADRQIAETHIEKWGLVEPAGGNGS